MRSIQGYLGGLNLYLAEVEALAQATYHLISLCEADTLTQLLLQTLIEYHKLELGANEQLFTLSFEKYGNLATETWITSLWQYASYCQLHIALLPLNMRIV